MLCFFFYITDGVSSGFKIYALLVLTLNATFYILLVRFTRARDGQQYLSTTTVLLTECSKLCISLCVLMKTHKGPVGMVKDVYKNVICDMQDTFKMAVPSVIYAIQNNLAFYALTYIDAATYQVRLVCNMNYLWVCRPQYWGHYLLKEKGNGIVFPPCQ